MRQDTKIALVVGVGVLAGLALALSEPPEPGRLSPEPKPQPKPDPKPEQKPDPKPAPAVPASEPASSDSTDDETALARMLESETNDRGARVVIGWYAIQTARSRKKSLFDRLTAGAGYGPRKKDGISRYASTARKPTVEAREVARRLLSGQIQPSAAIRSYGQSSWVEELADPAKKYTEQTASEVVKQQKKFGGIWGRIKGSRWYLFSEKTKPVEKGRQAGAARAALDSVRVFEPLDLVEPSVS